MLQYCIECGRSFKANVKCAGRKYCRDACRDAHRWCQRGGFFKLSPLTCSLCGKTFTPIRRNQKLCSDECRNLRDARVKGDEWQSGLAPGTIGALAELIVCADLLKAGWSVFRNVSPHGFCDLVAVKDGTTRFIEVRTGGRLRSGELTYPKNLRGNGVTDFAVYLPEGNAVFYFAV